uniref:PAX-interacting protein 1 n=1 Tax=Macrostomum lignano TaxID=282301 RepID=A0A1I8IKE9_9PLAT
MQSPVSVAIQHQHQLQHHQLQHHQPQHPVHSGASVVVSSSAAAVAAAVAQQQQRQQQQAAMMAAKQHQQLQQHPQLPMPQHHQHQQPQQQQHHQPGVLIHQPPGPSAVLKPPTMIGGPAAPSIAHAQMHAQQQQQPSQQQQQPPPKPTYVGHDCPEKLPVDLCLLGCIFFVPAFNDCPKYKQHWLDRIEARGGVTVQRYSPDRVTHVLLECLTCDEYFVALQDKKRIVSMNWLAACITKGTMEPPTELQHLPCIVDRQSSPSYCRDQVFAIHGFAVDDRLKLYYMIKSLGARYSPVLCATVSVLVCKKGDTDVVHKARGLGIAVVNAKFVMDLYRGSFAILAKPVSDKYSRWDANKNNELMLAKGESEALMAPWTTPVHVTVEMLQAAVENRKLMNSGDKKRKLEEAQADSTGSVKRIKLELAGAVNRDPANSSAAAAVTQPVWQRPTDEPLLVAVSGLTKEDRTQCAQLCTKLGGRLLKDTESEKCQILVTPSLAVTPKLLLAVSSGVPIVNTDWLNESASAEAWLQPESFALSDTDGERQLGISLASVLESSRQKKLFSGYTFCLGPTCGGCGGAVRDDLIRKLININGGHIIERLPPADQCHSELAPKHLFVGTEEDCHCVHYLLRGKHGRLVAIQKVAIPYSTACVATTAASAATACGRCSSSLR